MPGFKGAIANIELVKEAAYKTGDHLLLVGRVRQYNVNSSTDDAPLLSVGPDTRGFTVLANSGIHRIGVVDRL